MTSLHALILRASRSLGAFLALVLGFSLLLTALLRIGTAFATVTAGHLPFDLQNNLSVDEITAQLPRYTDASRSLYGLFALIDTAFPLVGGLMTAAAAAFLTRRASPDVYTRVEARRGFLVLITPTLFDWLENVAILAAIFTYPPGARPLFTLVVVFKKLKLASLALCQTAILLLAASALGKTLLRRGRERG